MIADQSLGEKNYQEEDHLVKLNQDIYDLLLTYSRIDMTKTNFDERYDDLSRRYDHHKTKLQDYQEQLKHRQQRLSDITEFRNQLQDKEELVTEFSQVLWQTLIDQLIIGEGKVITVQFRDGSQVEL